MKYCKTKIGCRLGISEIILQCNSAPAVLEQQKKTLLTQETQDAVDTLSVSDTSRAVHCLHLLVCTLTSTSTLTRVYTDGLIYTDWYVHRLICTFTHVYTDIYTSDATLADYT